MASPSEVRKDAVFQQAQEIFTQMEPEVIYMVLSEMDFNLDAAMESLIMLSLASEQEKGFKAVQEPTLTKEGRDLQSAHQLTDVNSTTNLDSSPQCPIYSSYYGQHSSPNDMLEDVPLKAMYTDFADNEPSLPSKDMFETMPPKISENSWSLTNFNALSAYSTNDSSAGETNSTSAENILRLDTMLLDMNSNEKHSFHEQLPFRSSVSKKLTREGDRREVYDATSVNVDSENKAHDSTKQDGKNKLLYIKNDDEEVSSALKDIKETEDNADEKVLKAGINESSKYLEALVDDLSEENESVDSQVKDSDVRATAKKLVISVLSYTGIGALNGVKMSFGGNGKMQPSSVLGMNPPPDPTKLFSKFKKKKKTGSLDDPDDKMSVDESSKEDVSLKESFVVEPKPVSDSIQDSKLNESKHLDESKNGEESEGAQDPIISPTVATQLKRLDTLIDESLKETKKHGKSQSEKKTAVPEESSKFQIPDLCKSESEEISLEEYLKVTIKTCKPDVLLEDNTSELNTSETKIVDKSKVKSESPAVVKQTLNDNNKQASNNNQWSFIDPPFLRRVNDVAMPPGLRLPNRSHGSRGGIRMPVQGGMAIYGQNTMYLQQPVYCNLPPGFYETPQMNPYFMQPYYTPRMPDPMFLQQQNVLRPAPPQSSEIKKSYSAMIVSSAPPTDAKLKKSQSQSAVHTIPRPNLIANGTTNSLSKAPQKIMYILRGLPGSGKSTLARKLAGKSGRVLSTDDFFKTKSGRYEFDINLLTDAHEWNKNRAKKCVQEGMTPVVIDNTNMTAWEMKPYAEIAIRHCYHVQIKEPDTPWKFKAGICAQKNSHGVPFQSIKNMRSKYEPDITLEKLLKMPTKVVPGSQPLLEKKSYQLSRPMHSMNIPSNMDCNKSDKLQGTKQANVTVPSNATRAWTMHEKNFPTPKQGQGYENKQNDLNQSQNVVRLNQQRSNDKKVLDCYSSPSSNSDIPISCSTPVSTVRCSSKDSLVPTLSNHGKENVTAVNTEMTWNAKRKEAHSNKVSQVPNLYGSTAIDSAFVSESQRESRTLHHAKKNHLGINERPRPKSLSPKGRTKAKSSATEHRFPFKKTLEDKQYRKQSGNKQFNIKLHTENPNTVSTRLHQKSTKSISEKRTSQEEKKEMETQDANLPQTTCNSQSERVDQKGEKDSPNLGSLSLDATMVINEISSAKEVPLNRPKTEEPNGTSSLRHIESKHADIAVRSVADESMLVIPCKDKPVHKDLTAKAGPRRTKLAAVFQTQSLLSEESRKKFVSCNDWGALGPVTARSSSVNETEEKLVDKKSNTEEDNTEIHRNSDLKQRPILKADKSSHTEMNDLVLVNKATSSKVELRDGMFVLSGKGDRFVPKSDMESTNDRFQHPAVLTFDKSSSTKEMEYDIKKKEEQITHDLDTLKLLFDDLPADKLHEVYQDCNRNLEWTSNILAESSMFGDASFTSKKLDSKSFTHKEETTTPKIPYEPEFPIELPTENPNNKDSSNIALNAKEAISLASSSSSAPGTLVKNSMNPVDVNSGEAASILSSEIDQSLTLRLSKEFVHAIAESFGGLPSEEDSTAKTGGKLKGQSYGSCSIRVDMKLAKQIHELWIAAAEKKKEMQRAYREFQQKKMRHAMQMQMNDDQMRTWELDEVKRLQEQYEQDEKLARRLQMAEDRGESEYQKPPLETEEVGKKMKKKNCASNREETPKCQASNASFGTPSYSRSDNLYLNESASYTPTSASTSSSNVWQNASKENSSLEPKPLLEIMMDETAAEESEQRQREKKWETADFATQMKRRELHGMYPGLPAELLDDIFCANNENLDSTVYAVNCLWLEDSPPPASAMSQDAREKYNDQILEMTKTKSLMKDGLVPGISEPMISHNSSALKDRSEFDIESSCYEDLRAEANLHKDQMEEAFKKAALAFQQKKRAVSTYYAHQGHLHRMRFKEANTRAAEVIYKQKNIGREERNEIDLHGLHVTEAIAKLSRKLAEKKSSSSPHIYIITGRGSNSHGGVPKIKNAATEWLKAHSYEFEEKNAGMLKVDL